jgi:hypothetical protein
MRGDVGGGLQSLSTAAHGALINFRHLIPYLTYVLETPKTRTETTEIHAQFMNNEEFKKYNFIHILISVSCSTASVILQWIVERPPWNLQASMIPPPLPLGRWMAKLLARLLETAALSNPDISQKYKMGDTL